MTVVRSGATSATTPSSWGEHTKPSHPAREATRAIRDTSFPGLVGTPTALRAAASSDVSTVTPSKPAVPPDPAASPACAAASMASPPETCAVTQRAPQRPSRVAAASTCVGMSWSLASANTGLPSSRSAAIVPGPGPCSRPRPILNPPTCAATSLAMRTASSAVGRSRATNTGGDEVIAMVGRLR